MASMDSLSRALPLVAVADLVKFIWPDITDLQYWETDIAEAPQLRLDKAFIARIHGKRCFIHIEMQTRVDSNMARRIIHYDMRLNMSEDEDIPVYTIVIWFSDETPPEPVYRQQYADSSENTWSYKQIRLHDLTKADLEHHGAGLLALSPFFGDVTADDIEPLAYRLKATASTEAAETLLMIFVSMAEERFGGIDMAGILLKVGLKMDAIREIIEKSSVAVALAERSREEGRAQGIETGRAQGIETGRAQGIETGRAQGESVGLIEAIGPLWQAHFGTELPEDVRVALEKTEVPVLRRLVREWMTLSEAQVRAELNVQV